MNKKEIELFEKTEAQLRSVYDEMVVVSRKKTDDIVNDFKLNLINKIVEQCNNILKNNNKPFDDFNLFNTDLLPSNSDVVFILSQYIGCMEKLRSENIENYGDWYWVINGKQSEIRTAPPKKISYNK